MVSQLIMRLKKKFKDNLLQDQRNHHVHLQTMKIDLLVKKISQMHHLPAPMTNPYHGKQREW